MSIRTLIVGILAAFCGITATLGVMSLSKPAVESATKKIIWVAASDINAGQIIENNLLAMMEWHAESLPVNAVLKRDDVLGKYSQVNIPKGEILRTTKFGDEPTVLLPADGMRAFTIEARSSSTNLGKNLVPGNRVDIIWQTSGRIGKEIDPVSLRLIQNVKILAIGQLNDAGRGDNITLEVKPKMDEDLAYSQAFGRLSLSLRNPGDEDGVDPIETVNFTRLLEDRTRELQELAARKEEPNPVWQQLLDKLSGRIDQLENKDSQPEEPVREQDIAIKKIGKGMRAITIQTPNEAASVAGLLEPGDRVDLQFTINQLPSNFKNFVLMKELEHQIPSGTLIENIEVLAVDRTLLADDRDGSSNKGKMSNSVTLIVKEQMQAEISRAEMLGTLTLTLRGESDREEGPPKTVMTVDDFVKTHVKPVEETVKALANKPALKIRTYKGSAVSEIPFLVK